VRWSWILLGIVVATVAACQGAEPRSESEAAVRGKQPRVAVIAGDAVADPERPGHYRVSIAITPQLPCERLAVQVRAHRRIAAPEEPVIREFAARAAGEAATFTIEARLEEGAQWGLLAVEGLVEPTPPAEAERPPAGQLAVGTVVVGTPPEPPEEATDAESDEEPPPRRVPAVIRED